MRPSVISDGFEDVGVTGVRHGEDGDAEVLAAGRAWWGVGLGVEVSGVSGVKMRQTGTTSGLTRFDQQGALGEAALVHAQIQADGHWLFGVFVKLVD